MAKAKKTETAKAISKEAATTELPLKSTGKKAEAKSAGKGKPTAPKPAAAPLVNTSFAAEAAARMIGAKATGATAPAAGEGKKETSTFKQLKESLAKPHAASVGNLLNSTIPTAAKKGNLPFHGGKQVGHNQTFGADASRNFVPRRTGG